jgi:hypothetical protein
VFISTSEAVADFAHAAAELPAQQRAQRYTFGIADSVAI